MIPDFFTSRPGWPDQIERIVESLGRVSAIEELSGRELELRRTNRIGSVHSSTAIEGNALTLAQVDGVAKGEPVFAPPRDVKEVENALDAYDALDRLSPWSIHDFLRAHGLLTAGLVAESGAFRTVDVEIVNAANEVVHTGSRVANVRRLMSELFEWGAATEEHPLVVSSATHFLIDAAPFIDYMLDVVTESLVAYEQRARADASGRSVGVNVGVNVGVTDAVLDLLRADPTLSAAAIAVKLGKTVRTIERHLAGLKSDGRVRREGPAKNGRWVVLGHPDLG